MNEQQTSGMVWSACWWSPEGGYKHNRLDKRGVNASSSDYEWRIPIRSDPDPEKLTIYFSASRREPIYASLDIEHREKATDDEIYEWFRERVKTITGADLPDLPEEVRWWWVHIPSGSVKRSQIVGVHVTSDSYVRLRCRRSEAVGRARELLRLVKRYGEEYEDDDTVP